MPVPAELRLIRTGGSPVFRLRGGKTGKRAESRDAGQLIRTAEERAAQLMEGKGQLWRI